MSPFDTFTHALEAASCRPKGHGSGQWHARCPAHDGRDFDSLSFKEGAEGRVVITCHSKSCSAEAVALALGLEMSDLFQGDSPVPRSRPKSINWREVACYQYQDPAGVALYEVVRLEDPAGVEPKTFRQRVPGAGGRGLPEGLQRVLYQLPELLAADPEKPVVVVEGEKDVHTLVRLGHLATTSAQGSKSAGKTDWSPVKGRRVVLIPDHDTPGEIYAAEVAELCRAAGAAEVRRVTLPSCTTHVKDVTSWLDDERTPDELHELIQSAPLVAERGTVTDLIDFINTDAPPSLDLLRGVKIAPGELMVLCGPQKLGKSALAVQWADVVASSGRPVLYITMEMPPAEVWARVLAPKVKTINTVGGELGPLWYSRVMRRENLLPQEVKGLKEVAREYPGRDWLRVVRPEPSRGEDGSVAWLVAQVKAETQRHGCAPFVIADYLQRIREPGEKERRLQVGEVAYQLRALVDELAVPLMVVSSVARGTYPTARTKWQPPAEDLAKESGEIEYSATSLYALWPSEDFHRRFTVEREKWEPSTAKPVELHTLLHRHGGGGERVLDLRFFPAVGQFQ